MKPYTYLVGWTDADLWYYGVQYHKDADPKDLWTKYFTSCKRITDIRVEHGEPDVIQVRHTFDDCKKAVEWEAKVLQRMKAASNPRWINRNVKGSIYNTPEQYAEIGRKQSATRKANYRPSWNKGLTKETDPRLAAVSARSKGRVFTESHKQAMRGLNKNTENQGRHIRTPEFRINASQTSVNHDKDILTMCHKDGRSFVGTKREFNKRFPQELKSGEVTNLKHGWQKTAKGWLLHSIDHSC
jgi:hypothetical protein